MTGDAMLLMASWHLETQGMCQYDGHGGGEGKEWREASRVSEVPRRRVSPNLIKCRGVNCKLLSYRNKTRVGDEDRDSYEN